MRKTILKRWQANFLTGLLVILPGVVSIALLLWIVGKISNLTDVLLIFLPVSQTHQDGGQGPMYWYWSLAALGIAVFLVCVLGMLARNYIGRQLIQAVDHVLLRVPLLNKIYRAIKQVNDAFSATNTTSFRKVVLVEYPRQGVYSIGFVTNDQPDELHLNSKQKMLCIFIPTTPIPTAGFLIVVSEDQTTPLDMSVADGIKYIISLGAISPESAPSPSAPVAPSRPPRS